MTLCEGIELYKSKRLLYRAAENNEEDKTFLQHDLFKDNACQLLGSARLRRPAHAGSAEDAVKSFQSVLLGVIICLRPDTATNSEGPESPDTPAQKNKPVPIGFVSLSQQGPEFAHHRSATLAISLRGGYRGQGYGGEAINWALDWAFEQAGLHRVGLTAFSFNHRALHLYKKLGFVEEGREREAVQHFRVWHDIVILGMLESEWEKLRGFTPEATVVTPSFSSELGSE
ncbi:acyl-CoA N-acyltransferase [Penicillium bovifimosum]|uniref:Acyl-CoA N-acyltransferase n=1 Tax=Penicillium bovifimosum TaxID=126998 RepID=A0A9W9GTX3_9EURO|nr:acyl-CoA N-acyltransferase [Penicillium bovifimosum]KAJ5129841.1 acyl-CoA N-acyltransferase [Penicillium bovifimosum]